MYLYISRFKFMLMSCKYIQPLTYISISHFVLFFSASNRLNNPLKYTVNYNEYNIFRIFESIHIFQNPVYYDTLSIDVNIFVCTAGV